VGGTTGKLRGSWLGLSVLYGMNLECSGVGRDGKFSTGDLI
jgi:hypothetical protein